jgi:Flp pilus assembly protein TadD/ferredoxin
MPLTVIQPRTQIRKSRSTRWRAAVLVLVHLAVAAHIAHWLATGRTLTPVEPSEAAALSRAGVINIGLIFFAVTILLTAIFGRFFCGWACHLVALQDLARALLEKIGRRPKPLRSRLLRWVPAVAFVYLFLAPALARLWRGGTYPRLQTEFTTPAFWATFPGWIVGGLTFLVCGCAAIYFLGAKGFCTYACPYGAAFGAAERLSPLRIRVTDACEHCGHCTATCTSNVRVHEEVRDFGMVVDSGCMKCLDCVSVCPNDALYYGVGPLPLFAERRASGRTMEKFPLSWAEEAVLAVAFVAGFLTFRGLYGYVPFLMALGIAGVLAYLTLLTWQLAARPNVAFKGWRLKRGGRLRGAGYAFLAAMALVVAVWGHSAAVRYWIARGDRSTGVAARWQGAVYDLVAPRPRLPAADRRRAEDGLAAYEAVQRIGWIDTLGLASRLAGLEYLLGDDSAARLWAQRSIAKDELAGHMHQLLGRLAFDHGDLAGAAAELERSIAADAYDARPHTSLGIVLAQSGDLERARRVFEGAIAEFGDGAALRYNLGLVEAYAGRLDRAAAEFGRVLQRDPRHLAARENRAGTLAALGRLEESAGQYALAIEQSPNDPRTRVLFGRVLAALGRRADAATQVDAALALEPAMPEALRLRQELTVDVESEPLRSPGD